MKREHKRALRSFILEKLGEVTCLQLTELAEQNDCHPFEMAEQFEIELQRIEKLFCYPSYDE